MAFTRKVDGGKLPALELDGVLYTESMDIMKLLDRTFPTPQMVPSPGTKEAKLADSLFQLEKELQSAWFSLVFYPVEGEALEHARMEFLQTLARVDESLGATEGPWFLGGHTPSIVDLQFITQVERIIASALYWKGIIVRGKYPNMDVWLAAFEQLPSYLATKGDYYSLVMAMPSQNGPGYAIDEAREVSNKIYGLDGAWELPLDFSLEPPMPTANANWEEAARHEAAFHLATRHTRVAAFACRGAGEPGRPSFHAELADPYADPNENYFSSVDVCLRHITVALLDGVVSAAADAARDLNGKGGSGELRAGWSAYEDDNDGRVYYWNDETGDVTYTPPTQQLDTCLAYLRDRIGVPRDMGQAAAMQLRAHLNWAIALLQ